MSEKEFYDGIWRKKILHSNSHRDRDLVHKLIIDKIVNPLANDRIDVAARILEPGGRILDLGCGKGDFLNHPVIKEKFSERYGIDVSEISIKCAIDNGLDNCIQWNLNDYPFPYENSTFDVIAMLAVLEHLFDPYSVFSEVNRLIQPNGHIVIALPNVASLSNRIRLLFGLLPVTSEDQGWDGGHLHYFTIQSTRDLLEQFGYKVIKIYTSGGWQSIRKLCPGILSGEFIIYGRKI